MKSFSLFPTTVVVGCARRFGQTAYRGKLGLAGATRFWKGEGTQVRWGSSDGAERNRTASKQGSSSLLDDSFAALGLDSTFVKALRHAFPDVQAPTEVQQRLIPEVLGNKDILLKDITGSGKSFGLVLGLLNKPRRVLHGENGEKRKVITTLFIVPHRDLAFQFSQWIQNIVNALRPSSPPPLPSIVQVLVRDNRMVEDRIAELKKTPPHILICTPQALKDVYGKNKEALQLDTLSTVVVDEVDYLVDVDNKLKKIRHPGPTMEMLDVVYARRKELRENQYDVEEEEEGRYKQNAKEAETGIPQLILSTATMRVHFKNYLFTQTGWLNTGNLVKISGEKEKRNERVRHSILVVEKNGRVRNMKGGEVKEEGPARGFEENAIELIRSAVLSSVRSIGLVVIPASAPVHLIVSELRKKNMDARPLDLLVKYEQQQEPVVLVGTVATTRGVDLPSLSHVFILGDAVRSKDGYVHVAGRTGRFGREGRVVSICSSDQHALARKRILISIGEQLSYFQLT